MTNHTHHHSSHTSRFAGSFREALLVVLVGALAFVAIYVSTDTNTAFGLLTQPVYADFVPVKVVFHSDVLLSEPFLELQLVNRNPSTQQVSGSIFDPTNPPPVTDLTALNTRIGSEVIVYWTLPAQVKTVNVYRANTTKGEAEVRVAENLAAEQYVDTTVVDGEVYVYRVITTVVDGEKIYESTATAPKTAVTPSDGIPPQAPTAVRVEQVDAVDGGLGLRITWTNPTAKDLAVLVIHRSTQLGSRGQKVASVPARDPAEYIDTEAPKNTPVYYTVVAYDNAGNASSDDFQMPLAGNSSPFTPIGATQ